MGVESATYISELDNTFPLAGDPVSAGDDHIRLLKSVLQAQFSALGAAAVTPTAAEINKLASLATTAVELGYVTGLTSAVQAQLDLKAPLASPTFTGVAAFAGGYSEDDDATASGGAITLDTAVATYFHTVTLASIPTFTFSNPASSGSVTSFTLELNNASNFAPVWPATVTWSNGDIEPIWSAGTDIVSFFTRDGGTTWRGVLGGLNF